MIPQSLCTFILGINYLFLASASDEAMVPLCISGPNQSYFLSCPFQILSFLLEEGPRQRDDSSTPLSLSWEQSSYLPSVLGHEFFVSLLTTIWSDHLFPFSFSSNVVRTKKMVQERKPNGRYFENWVLSPIFPSRLQLQAALPPWTL